MSRLLTIVLSAATISFGMGCAGRSSPAGGLNAASVLRRVGAQYGSLRTYSDEGSARYTAIDGFTEQKWFRTRFDRRSGLVFEIAADPAFSHPERLKVSGAPAGTAVIVDPDGKSSDPTTITAASAELQGVGLYSSLFVPRLLFGVDFCACSADDRWALDGEGTLEGRPVTRIRFRSGSARALVLLVDKETSLLQQVKVEMLNEGRLEGEITIRYAVSSASQ